MLTVRIIFAQATSENARGPISYRICFIVIFGGPTDRPTDLGITAPSRSLKMFAKTSHSKGNKSIIFPKLWRSWVLSQFSPAFLLGILIWPKMFPFLSFSWNMTEALVYKERLQKYPVLARAIGVPVDRCSGGRLAIMLVATINDIIFFFSFLRYLLFS